jgi:hypothetical protein
MLTFNPRLILAICAFISINGLSQIAWTWTPLADMPFKISNNAVSEGTMGGNPYVYSFGGIDETKIWSGITQRSFRYDVTNDIWNEISPLPSSLANIAASANTVKNKIYIIGGYSVASGGGEISSDEVIIYDPETNAYLTNGAAIPIPIDDQTQCVWKDSLIYVITGWSNTSNVPNVQIYDPALDQWQVGTQTVNDGTMKAFGSSGNIIGDTIYYYGGAVSTGQFNSQDYLRKGVINPADPTQITWTLEEDGPNNNYRSACLTHGNNVFWVGGSETSYNYNGIAYNGTGGVSPLTQVARYETYYHDWYAGDGAPYGVMDLRGKGKVSSTSWIICGGMEAGQLVSDKAYLLTYDPVVGGIDESAIPTYQLINHELFFDQTVSNIQLIGLDGKMVTSVSDYKIGEQYSGVFILKFGINGKVYHDKIYLK